jgi:hypothetical protein
VGWCNDFLNALGGSIVATTFQDLYFTNSYISSDWTSFTSSTTTTLPSSAWQQQQALLGQFDQFQQSQGLGHQPSQMTPVASKSREKKWVPKSAIHQLNGMVEETALIGRKALA